jgi:hypothetical protein
MALGSVLPTDPQGNHKIGSNNVIHLLFNLWLATEYSCLTTAISKQLSNMDVLVGGNGMCMKITVTILEIIPHPEEWCLLGCYAVWLL